jgi:hypothetical protein
VPRVLLYDNLKSADLEPHGDAIRFHPTLLEMSAHYRFEPRPVAVARGNEKGRVERAIRYVRDAFFAARSFTDLADPNRQAAAWTATAAADRSWVEDRARTVRQAFEDERGVLLPLAAEPFPAYERIEVEVGTGSCSDRLFRYPHGRSDGTAAATATMLVHAHRPFGRPTSEHEGPAMSRRDRARSYGPLTISWEHTKVRRTRAGLA